MPIRAEFRNFYRGPAWLATRKRILGRARNRCEQCGKPNHTRVFVLSERVIKPGVLGIERIQLWLAVEGGRIWRDCWGKQRRDIRWSNVEGCAALPRSIYVCCTVAHLNHIPGDDREENLRLLCGWCHLNYDKLHHRNTRCARKDAVRPILLTADGPR